MFKKNDPNTFIKFCDLIDTPPASAEIYKGNTPLSPTPPNPTIGSVYLEYIVKPYEDLRLNNKEAAKPKTTRSFLVECTQRIMVYNENGLTLNSNNASKDVNSYENYPAAINTFMQIQSETGLTFDIIDYSPKTINTKIQSSSSGNSDKTANNSQSSTVGSSTAQTNSYGASVSVGFGVANVTANYDHSHTSSQDQSDTNEMGKSTSEGASNSASMSIKDWGAYSLINPNIKSPTWIFGQEYPWDVIECRKTSGKSNPNNTNQNCIVIPKQMIDRLYDGVSLYPPSQISMFGANFVMKAYWIVTLEDGASSEITIDHTIDYYTGSHYLNTSHTPKVNVYFDGAPSSLNPPKGESLSTVLNLRLMALEPIPTSKNSAIVGFVPNKFIVAPSPGTATSATKSFKIKSIANNLLIEDTTKYVDHKTAGGGFTSSPSALIATFAADCKSLSMVTYFKIIDTTNDYSLYIKHWKTKTEGVLLTMIINGDTANPITKYVDASEAEGGEHNLLSVSLRNLDYSSVDYHDYLELGLNGVEITIQPIDDTKYSDCEYQIRAISIEKN